MTQIMRQVSFLPMAAGGDYLLTGGATAEQLRPQLAHPVDRHRLLASGSCLPLRLEGTLGETPIVVGALNRQEQQEWIGRIATRLEVGQQDVSIFAGPQLQPLAQLALPPGSYVAEILCYIGAPEVARHFAAVPPPAEWLHHAATEQPAWITPYLRDGDFRQVPDRVGYLLHFEALEVAPEPPPLNADGWCDRFSFRELKLVPQGLSRQALETEARRPV